MMPATVRCFVALWPDEAARDRLCLAAQAQKTRFPRARQIPCENLHLTLAFIGELDENRAAQVAVALETISIQPFTWMLDRLGAFDRARVLWAAGPDSPPLAELARRVRTLLDELRVPYDRKPFVAHVTLLRDVSRDAARQAAYPIEPPIAWQAGRAVLLRSVLRDGHVRYEGFADRVAAAAAFGEDQDMAKRSLTRPRG
jgi:2'-5' RNA ligase